MWELGGGWLVPFTETGKTSRGGSGCRGEAVTPGKGNMASRQASHIHSGIFKYLPLAGRTVVFCFFFFYLLALNIWGV